MEISILLVLLTVAVDHPPAAEHAPPANAACTLVVDGKYVTKLTLEEQGGRTYQKDVTGQILHLEPGRYRLRQVLLKGDYSHDSYSETEWFSLTSNKPYHLRAGSPLTPRVDATREGRILKLDYRLVDDAGRRYRRAGRESPPGFTVYKNGKEVASDAFEYG